MTLIPLIVQYHKPIFCIIRQTGGYIKIILYHILSILEIGDDLPRNGELTILLCLKMLSPL